MKNIKLVLIFILAMLSTYVYAGVDNSPTWEDPATKLIWSRSIVKPDGGNILPVIKEARWWDAIDAISASRYLGYSDWRLPTAEELDSIYNNDDAVKNIFINNIQDKKYGPFYSIWTSTFKTSIASSNSTYSKVNSEVIYVDAVNKFESNYKFINPYNLEADTILLMVRGGNKDIKYSDIFEAAKKAKESFNNYTKVNKEHDAKQKSDVIDMQARNAAGRQAFQKSLKVGDNTHQGLIINIDGNLIQVQRYSDQKIVYVNRSDLYR